MSTNDCHEILLKHFQGGVGDVVKSVPKPPSLTEEKDGIFYFYLDPTEKVGDDVLIEDRAKILLNLSNNSMMHKGLIKIAIIPGWLFPDEKRTTRQIRRYANRRGFIPPDMKTPLLIRSKFSDQEIRDKMGIWWVVGMSRPIINNEYPFLLGTDINVGQYRIDRCLTIYSGKRSVEWIREYGFAFIDPT